MRGAAAPSLRSCPETSWRMPRGWSIEGARAAPLRLRPARYPAGGVSGEDFPVVGEAGHYTEKSEAGVGIAYLYHPDTFEGESVGIIETPFGKGRILAFAFDLPECVFTLRQGDPRQVERAVGGNARADSIGIDLGPADSGLVPFADLLARWLVELVCRFVPAPVPLLWHLPGDAAAIVLYSGDEDGAEISATEQEFREVTAAGARMNLYIIPIGTDSTARGRATVSAKSRRGPASEPPGPGRTPDSGARGRIRAADPAFRGNVRVQAHERTQSLSLLGGLHGTGGGTGAAGDPNGCELPVLGLHAGPLQQPVSPERGGHANAFLPS